MKNSSNSSFFILFELFLDYFGLEVEGLAMLLARHLHRRFGPGLRHRRLGAHRHAEVHGGPQLRGRSAAEEVEDLEPHRSSQKEKHKEDK